MNTFIKNFEFIENFNQQDNQTFYLAMNEFGDLTSEEFARIFLSSRPSANAGFGQNSREADATDDDISVASVIPNEIEEEDSLEPLQKEDFKFWDWRNHNVVGPIKNQGVCGSCWAFAAVAAIESRHAIKTGQLINLSEQQVLDCASDVYGCHGGKVSAALDYINRTKGIAHATHYPYSGSKGACEAQVLLSAKAAVTIRGFQAIPRNDEISLAKIVRKTGPVAALVNAASPAFQFYAGGVYEEPTCTPHFVNHAVTVIGYGSEEDESPDHKKASVDLDDFSPSSRPQNKKKPNSPKDYWLLRNSWGTLWGINGYMKLIRNKNSHCGISTFGFYPLL